VTNGMMLLLYDFDLCLTCGINEVVGHDGYDLDLNGFMSTSRSFPTQVNMCPDIAIISSLVKESL
jgi:hypothetical protein